MDTLDSFAALASAVAPPLHMSVSMERHTTARGTSYLYKIRATGNKLSTEVRVQADTQAEAVRLLKPAIAKVRRADAIEQVLKGLRAYWNEVEREGIRARLLSAHGRADFDLQASMVTEQDTERYNTEMGNQYQNQGYSDGWAA